VGVYCLNYVRGLLKVRGPGLSELKRQGGAFIDAYGASQLATLPTGDSSVVRWFGNRSTQTSVWHSIQERLQETTGLHRIKTLRTVDLRVFIQIVNIGSRSKNNLHEIELIDEQTTRLQATLLTGFSSARTQVTARLFTGAQQESSASCTSSQVKYRVVI